jgi:uncharacterized membrane protein
MPNPQSTVKISGHPIHPMLIPFPIAFFVSAFVCDLVFWRTGNPGWATAALWFLGIGVIMGLLAAAAGLTDFLGDSRIRDLTDAWWHFLGNLTAVILALINWYRQYATGDAAIIPWGLVLSLIVVLILFFTG